MPGACQKCHERLTVVTELAPSAGKPRSYAARTEAQGALGALSILCIPVIFFPLPGIRENP
jgi:hypothetical protein